MEHNHHSRGSDSRLVKKLNIHEFRTAFGLYKNVMCETEPHRRKELDSYVDHIDDMYRQYGGMHFYDYHNAFSRKAEQYEFKHILLYNYLQ